MSIKEKWQKVKKWCKEHQASLIGATIGVAGAGAVIGTGLLLLKNTAQTPLGDITVDEKGHSQYALPDWNESYRENWDKINEFAETLTLEPGEMYIIEDGNQYRGEGLPCDITVSHLVYGDGVYPPKEE